MGLEILADEPSLTLVLLCRTLSESVSKRASSSAKKGMSVLFDGGEPSGCLGLGFCVKPFACCS